MRRTAGFLLLTAALSVSSAQAQERCRSIPQLPQKLLVIPYDGKHTFDDRKLGIQVRYKGLGRSLSIYVYDFGLDTIDDAVLNQHFANAVKELRFVAARRGNKIVSEQNLATRRLGEFPFHAKRFIVSYGQAKSNAFDYVGMSRTSGCLLKVRFTDLANTNADQSLRRFGYYAVKAHELFR